MNLLVTSIVLAIVAAIFDAVFGIKEPWRKIIYFGILILFALGLLFFLVPGIFGPYRI